MGYKKKTELLILSFYFKLIGNGKVLRLYSDIHAALPPLPSAVKSVFQFSSALRGGKLEIAFTLRVLVAEIFQSEFPSSFRFFCLLVAPGVGA